MTFRAHVWPIGGPIVRAREQIRAERISLPLSADYRVSNALSGRDVAPRVSHYRERAIFRTRPHLKAPGAAHRVRHRCYIFRQISYTRRVVPSTCYLYVYRKDREVPTLLSTTATESADSSATRTDSLSDLSVLRSAHDRQGSRMPSRRLAVRKKSVRSPDRATMRRRICLWRVVNIPMMGRWSVPGLRIRDDEGQHTRSVYFRVGAHTLFTIS